MMYKVLKPLHFCLAFAALYFAIFSVPSLQNTFSYLCALFVLLYLSQWLMESTRKYFSFRVSSENRAVLITGCDSGFGNLLARKLDGLEFQVFACCINSQGGGANDLKSSCSERLKIIEMDVTKDDSVQDAYDAVKKELGSNSVLWAVVNNAGIIQIGEVDWCPIYDFQRVIEVNTMGPIRITKAFLPLLKKSKGRIVNICSNIGRKSYPAFVGYAMSKSAAISFTEGLRVEMAKWNIDVVGIEPYFYRTPLTTTENVFRQVIDTWERAPEDIRNDVYGEEYMKAFKVMTLSILNLSSSSVEDVLECLVDAVCTHQPLSVYFPCYAPYKAFLKLVLALPGVVFETLTTIYLNYFITPLALIKKEKTSKNQ